MSKSDKMSLDANIRIKSKNDFLLQEATNIIHIYIKTHKAVHVKNVVINSYKKFLKTILK